MNPRHRLPVTLLATYAVVWVLCAINPLYPADWLLENVLVALFVPIIVWHYRKNPATTFAYIALFLFMCLHTLGSHYTYAEVPYDSWWQGLTGDTFNSLVGWERNNYDRVVHFGYGLLTTPIWVEILRRGVPGMRGFWAWLIPLTFMMSHSMLYELIEWLAAVQFGGELGQAYLGTQGDIWDAHWDMLLATIGSVVTIVYMRVTGRLGDGARGSTGL